MNDKLLKAELEKFKTEETKLQSLLRKNLFNPDFAMSGVLSAVGWSLTPTIHKVGMSFGIKRTKTGSYRVHGKTYRTKKLAETRWMKDCSILQNFTDKKKGSLIENLVGRLGDMSGLILPVMYNFFKKKDLKC